MLGTCISVGSARFLAFAGHSYATHRICDPITFDAQTSATSLRPLRASPANTAENNIVIGEAAHIGLRPLVPICISGQMEVSVKRLLNLGFVVVALALFVFANTLRSHSPSDDRSALTTGSAPGKKPQTVAGVNKLPNDEYEDLSFVFSTPPKH